MLNSVWLEGHLQKPMSFELDESRAVLSFHNDTGDKGIVEVIGTGIPARQIRKIVEGQAVRVIGRLVNTGHTRASDEETPIAIEVELIEAISGERL